MGREPPAIASEAERARSILAQGVGVFRWAALVWMAVLAVTSGDFRRPELAWALIGAAAVWTAWVSVPRRERGTSELWFDLAVAVALVILSGVVVGDGDVVRGRPFFATAYPGAAVLSWAVRRGPGGGLLAALAVGAGLVASRPVNGVPLDQLTATQLQVLANGWITYLLAGGAVGFVARLLDRSAAQLRLVIEERVREGERAARLAERGSLARQIHDSVLQALALVHKRGRELAAAGPAPPEEVRRLAATAGEQEEALRGLILRDSDDAPTGTASLRDALEALARSYGSRLPVSVAAVGPVFLDARTVEEVDAAVRQALDNAVEHANASKVGIFVDEVGGEALVSVRDDGVGFDPAGVDERSFGLRSMRGRIEDLGGRFTISSGSDRGTEVEMRVPIT
jgi:signal transduction histidine kinase